MEFATYVLSVITVILSLLLYLLLDRHNYWKIRGIPHDKPNFFFGNVKGVTSTCHFIDILRELYQKFKGSGPFCGIYVFLEPAALVLDLELVKKILIKDFNTFNERGTYHNEKDDPLSAHLFNVGGRKWRRLRNKFSPTFSSGKMKFMFQTVVEVGQRYAQTFGDLVGDKGAIVEVKELNARFTTDVIGTCAFGIECNSLKDPNAEFRVYGRKMVEQRAHSTFIVILMQSCQNIWRKLGVKLIHKDVESFIMNLVKNTVEYRERNSIRRNDFMDILIDMMKNEKSISNVVDQDDPLSIEEVAAEALVFYLAGFETSSSTISFAMLELALNTGIQERLRTEITDTLSRHGGELTYDAIVEMNFLDQIIEETLRLYPVVPFLQRRATEDYLTNDPKYKIEEGTLVYIPVEAFHKDPEIFDNPTIFDPDRFGQVEKTKRHSMAWLGFGAGPRNCIGLRFGKMQTKIGIALIIKNFRLHPCEKTKYPVKIDCEKFLLQPVGGLFINIERINCS